MRNCNEIFFFFIVVGCLNWDCGQSNIPIVHYLTKVISREGKINDA